MEFIGPAFELGKPLWTSIVEFEKIYEDLKNKAKDLCVLREDVKLQLDRDTVEKVPTIECKTWLEKVQGIENEVNEIENEYNGYKIRKREWVPDVSSRLNLGKRMVETIDRIKEILKYEGQVVVDAPRNIVEIRPADEIETKTATERTVQNIMNCIRNEKIGKIGVWGMGGVGKTRAMESLNNQLELNQMFEIVIWVTVSKDWSLRKVQKEIGERLLLPISDEESEDRVSRRLFQKLERIKYLLLLDDMWDKLDLHKLGVPYPNQQNGCKMVLTTRYLQVCRKMETNEDIKVEILSEEEAWNLFHKKAGKVVDSLEIQPLAKDVVKECGGLPLAIIVVGASLRDEDDVPVWRNAVRELRSPATTTYEIEEMEKEVFKKLKFSYDRLRDDNMKNCFLYAALYPEDHAIEISELIEYWRGEGFLYDVKTLMEARDKGHTILKYLVDASLFESAENDCIKMHDVIRDLALRITSPLNKKCCKFLVKAGMELAKPPEDEEWEQAERISLMENDLNSLLQKPRCPALLTLLLQGNWELSSIPISFFLYMSSLRVLDLSYTDIHSLPESICNLVNLRALYLGWISLLPSQVYVVIPSQVGLLTRLETLHIESCKYLPDEIVNLSRLTSLKVRLQIFDDVENINQQKLSILSRLLHLEELILIHRDTGNDFSVEGLVRTVCELKELTSLRFYFPTMNCLKYFLQNSHSWIDGRLTSFNFYIGEKRSLPYAMRHRTEYRSLVYSLGDSIPHEILKVLNGVSYFRLDRHSTVQKLSDFGVQNFKGLKHCLVEKCDVMEAFLEDEICALPSLETLRLLNLPMLKSLWKGSSMPPKSLVDLTVMNCPNLKRLPLGILDTTTLRRIGGEREWWDALEWEDDAIKEQLKPLFKVTIWEDL